MLGNEAVQVLMNRLDAAIGKNFNRFHIDVDPKKSCYLVKVHCRVCKAVIGAQESFKQPGWDYNIERDILAIAILHAKGHGISTIAPPRRSQNG